MKNDKSIIRMAKNGKQIFPKPLPPIKNTETASGVPNHPNRNKRETIVVDTSPKGKVSVKPTKPVK